MKVKGIILVLCLLLMLDGSAALQWTPNNFFKKLKNLIFPKNTCKVAGKVYNVGATIVESTDAASLCKAKTICGTGGIPLSMIACPSTTPQPITTTEPPTTMRITTPPKPPGSCFYNGKLWGNNEVISEGQTGRWCYFTACSNGDIISGDDWNCGPTSTTHAPTTTEPPTTMRITTPPRPQGSCIYHDKLWGNGEFISKGKSGRWCYFTKCVDGQILSGDDFNCGPPSTYTPPPISTPSGI